MLAIALLSAPAEGHDHRHALADDAGLIAPERQGGALDRHRVDTVSQPNFAVIVAMRLVIIGIEGDCRDTIGSLVSEADESVPLSA